MTDIPGGFAPAFPTSQPQYTSGPNTHFMGGPYPSFGTITVPGPITGGLSLRQYAAIHLCVPDSGTDWLDDLIRRAQRDRIAAHALSGAEAGRSWVWPLRNMTGYALKLADALLAERAKSSGGAA